jgi:protein-tyrosine phosphatase
MTDYHSHILPGFDDGAKDVATSLEMLSLLKKHGVKRVAATPHFRAHRETSVQAFLERRQKAYEKLKKYVTGIEIILGAEVSVEHGISELPGIEKLAMEGTDLILLEPPYSGYRDWIPDEIHNLSCAYHLTPLIAHIHRYVGLYSKAEMDKMLEIDAAFQINNEAFGEYKQRKLAKHMLKSGYSITFGSDSHNLEKRRPNFDFLKKKAKREWIETSNQFFEFHRRILEN